MIKLEDEKTVVKEPKVIPIVDEWYLGADNYCYILYRRHKITGGRGGRAKEENIGTYTYTAVGYYTTISAVFNAVVAQYTRETINKPRIKTLEDLADAVNKFVERVKKIDVVFVEAMKKKGGLDE